MLRVPPVAQAARGYRNCAGFITSLPTTIVASGLWCLDQSLSTAVTNVDLTTATVPLLAACSIGIAMPIEQGTPMTRLRLYVLVILTLLGAPGTAHAAKSYANCTGFISSLPATIDTPGIWCLNQNLSYSAATGRAVNIIVDRVTIDCNDFTLDGTAAGVGTFSIGIRASFRQYVTVRNCNIRGFHFGILLDGTYSIRAHYLVEDNIVDRNTFSAIDVSGSDSVLRRNRVSDTGGTTDVDGSASGITLAGSGDIVDNTVSGAVATIGSNGDANGIRAFYMFGGSVSGNRVRSMVKDGTGRVRAIYAAAGDQVTLRNNDLVGDSSVNSTGLSCDAGGYNAKGNIINGFATGIDVCTDAGGNVIKP